MGTPQQVKALQVYKTNTEIFFFIFAFKMITIFFNHKRSICCLQYVSRFLLCVHRLKSVQDIF